MRVLSLIGVFAAAISLGAEFPRQSPEFVIHMPGGEKQLLSKYRGKVVVCEFLFTTCPHCQHTAELYSKLQDDYGSKGFQAIGVAFNEMSNMLVPDFIRDHKPTFPVGFASREAVMSYLGLKMDERFVVPQIVLIDRKGVIRMQSPPLGDPNLQEEKFIRVKIEELLGMSGAARTPVPAAVSGAMKKATTKQ